MKWDNYFPIITCVSTWLLVRHSFTAKHFKELDSFNLQNQSIFTIFLNRKIIKLIFLFADEDLQQRLSLTVLKNFENLPSFGYKLVPQHVETRSLYRNECPGIEQVR